jgi:hypothetical protein
LGHTNALAAVAVTGGAFAQAVMTGSLAYGYRSTQTTAGVTASGMGVDGASIDFAVAEDIEGLGKVSGKLGVALKNKDASADSGDSELAIDFGAAGKVKMSNYYSASWLGGTAAGNANQYCSFSYGALRRHGQQCWYVSTYGYNDEISYTIPLTSTLSAIRKQR